MRGRVGSKLLAGWAALVWAVGLAGGPAGSLAGEPAPARAPQPAVAQAAGPGAKLRPWKVCPRLFVNPTMEFRAVVHLGEAAGLAQIQALAAGAQFEESWVFVPDQGLWIEVGCSERKTPFGTYVALEGYVFQLMDQFPRLKLYHVHPQGQFRRETYGPRQILRENVAEALPSFDDIKAMVLLSRVFRAGQPWGEMSFGLVSRHGLTTYGLTAAGREARGEISARRFVFSPLDSQEWLEEDSPARAALARPDQTGPLVHGLIRQAAGELCGHEVWVAFSPELTPDH
ncbi:MAG: hypothetical protein KQJ78_09330 [Deltaproteobacteria bacterium]|nr:hypothetical protein [Deltaproteobacteria bacterium]